MGLFKKANWPQVYQQLPKTVIERGHKYLSLTSPLSKSCQAHPGTVQGFKFRFKSTWADTFVMLLSLALLSWAAALNTPGGKLTQQKRGKKPQYWDHTRKSAEESRGGEQGHSNIQVKLLKYLHLSGSCLHPLLCWPSLEPRALCHFPSDVDLIYYSMPKASNSKSRAWAKDGAAAAVGVETGVRQKRAGDSPTGTWRSWIRQEPFSSVVSEQLVVPQSSTFPLPMEAVSTTFPTPAPGHSLSSKRGPKKHLLSWLFHLPLFYLLTAVDLFF